LGEFFGLVEVRFEIDRFGVDRFRIDRFGVDWFRIDRFAEHGAIIDSLGHERFDTASNRKSSQPEAFPVAGLVDPAAERLRRTEPCSS